MSNVFKMPVGFSVRPVACPEYGEDTVEFRLFDAKGNDKGYAHGYNPGMEIIHEIPDDNEIFTDMVDAGCKFDLRAPEDKIENREAVLMLMGEFPDDESLVTFYMEHDNFQYAEGL